MSVNNDITYAQRKANNYSPIVYGAAKPAGQTSPDADPGVAE